jgi:hypothetical protein
VNDLASQDAWEITRQVAADREVHSAVANTAMMLVPQLVAETERNGDPVRPFCYQAVKVLEELDWALHPDAEPKNRTRLWWHHGNVTVQTAKQYTTGRSVKKELLESAISNYLDRKWMHHDHIDWCIIDALVYWEWEAFMLRLVYGSGTAQIRFAAVMGAIGSAVLWFVNSSQLARIDWYAITFALSVVVWICAPSVATLLHRDLLAAMKRSYQALNGPVLSPTRIRDQLISAHRRGVVWPHAI